MAKRETRKIEYDCDFCGNVCKPATGFQHITKTTMDMGPESIDFHVQGSVILRPANDTHVCATCAIEAMRSVVAKYDRNKPRTKDAGRIDTDPPAE